MAEIKDTKLCTNCDNEIKLSNFFMHEAFCLRNIRPCDICKMKIDKNLKDQHFDEYHATQKCICGKDIEKRFYEQHQKIECTKRKMQCEYCDLEIDFDKYDTHINTCGTRTEMCDLCRQYVKLKDKQIHLLNNCKIETTNQNNSNNNNNNNPYRIGYNRESSFVANELNRVHGIITPQRFYNPSVIPQHQYFNPFTASASTSSSSMAAAAAAAAKSYYTDTVSSAIAGASATSNRLAAKTKDEKKHEVNSKASISDEGLPCEFCSELYPLEILFHHQPVCTKNPDRETHEPEATDPNILNRFDEFRLYGDDQGHDTDTNVMDNLNDYHVDIRSEEAYPELIPCQYCDELYSFENIEEHQITCQTMFDTLDGVNIVHNVANRNENEKRDYHTTKTDLNKAAFNSSDRNKLTINVTNEVKPTTKPLVRSTVQTKGVRSPVPNKPSVSGATTATSSRAMGSSNSSHAAPTSSTKTNAKSTTSTRHENSSGAASGARTTTNAKTNGSKTIVC